MTDVKRIKHSSIRRSNLISSITGHTLLTILAFIWLIPIVWILLQSFSAEVNNQGQLIGFVRGNYFPKVLGIDNYINLFTNKNFEFGKWWLNTLFVAFFTFMISTLLTLSVAYVMSKLRFKSRKTFMSVSMILGLFPGFMSMIAIYYILKAMGLTGSLFALILVYSAGSGLGFHVAKGFFDVIPNSLVESARLDGCTNAGIFSKIILPLSKPIIVYTALTAFMGPWMDFIFAKTIIGESNRSNLTVAFGLYSMIYGEQADSNLFTQFAAGSVLVAIPIVILFVSMQRYYVEGVTAGSVKG